MSTGYSAGRSYRRVRPVRSSARRCRDSLRRLAKETFNRSTIQSKIKSASKTYGSSSTKTMSNSGRRANQKVLGDPVGKTLQRLQNTLVSSEVKLNNFGNSAPSDAETLSSEPNSLLSHSETVDEPPSPPFRFLSSVKSTVIPPSTILIPHSCVSPHPDEPSVWLNQQELILSLEEMLCPDLIVTEQPKKCFGELVWTDRISVSDPMELDPPSSDPQEYPMNCDPVYHIYRTPYWYEIDV